MMHVQLWLNAVMLLAVFSYTECARILGVYGTGATSHKNIVTSVLKELASRGHQVTVITPLPENENRPNYTEISTEAQKEKVMEDSTGGKDMFQIGDIPSFPMMIFMWNVGQKFSEFTLKTEAVQKLLSDSTQHFDLVFVENFYSEAFLGFSHIFNAPIVTICTFSGTEEIGDSVGDPYPYSYVPTPYYDFTDHMTFYQRLQNTLLNVFVKLGRILYYLPKQEAIMRKYFTQKPNLPSITELDRSTSLVLLNTHFSFNFPRPHVPNLIEVGGLHIKRPNKLPQDLQTFLDNSPEGVVYFSMGSNLQSADMPIEKKLAFLNAFSRLKQKVLWKFEDKSLDNIPKNVKIQKWLPQSDLLDDTTFLSVGKEIINLQEILTTIMEECSIWFKANGFLLNENKTQNCVFSLRNTDDNLDVSPSVKFLGIYIDSKLNWDVHIDYILKKLSRVLYVLRRIIWCLPTDYVRTVYFACFQSIISYGLLVWGNNSKMNEVLLLQKKSH